MLQTDSASLTASAWKLPGAESLRRCWRLVFASLASAKSGKEDLRRQTLTGSFLYKQFWQERCYEHADFGYLQQRLGDDYQGSS